MKNNYSVGSMLVTTINPNRTQRIFDECEKKIKENRYDDDKIHIYMQNLYITLHNELLKMLDEKEK